MYTISIYRSYHLLINVINTFVIWWDNFCIYNQPSDKKKLLHVIKFTIDKRYKKCRKWNIYFHHQYLTKINICLNQTYLLFTIRKWVIWKVKQIQLLTESKKYQKLIKFIHYSQKNFASNIQQIWKWKKKEYFKRKQKS